MICPFCKRKYREPKFKLKDRVTLSNKKSYHYEKEGTIKYVGFSIDQEEYIYRVAWDDGELCGVRYTEDELKRVKEK